MTRTTKRLAVAALSGGAVVAAALTGAASASASAPARVPTVIAHVSSKSVSLSTGSRLHAGRVQFKVVTGKGAHELQIARLKHGYSFAQAGADLGQAFSGNVAAVRRVDANISFRGGAEARPHHPGLFGVSLSAGQYVFTDQNSNAYRFITVYGKAPARRALPHNSSIGVYTYGFDATPNVLPRKGITRIFNVSDQPHFIVFQHVKKSTTNAQVAKYFRSMSDKQPSWALKANTSSGVISNGRSQTLRYSLPAGKYVIACFWPDDDTGMPHAYMGMWKVINLR
jgi:hypothetical protein